MKLALTINGKRKEVDVDDDMPLVWILRDSLGMIGTKFGCGVGVCGSCTVLEDGSKAVRSCQIPAYEAKDRNFTTIEGLSDKAGHPMQQAWLKHDVAQCGFCQPGMIMNACALFSQHEDPTDAQIDSIMSESVCRCGTYPRMRKAIIEAAREMREHRP